MNANTKCIFEACCLVDSTALCNDPKAANVAVKKAIEIWPKGNGAPKTRGSRTNQGEIFAGICAGKTRGGCT